MTLAFYISGAIAVVATVMAITRLNAIHALLYLIVALLAIAVTFYTLGAPFIAALEVIIYAGAIMVLFVFVVMLLNLGEAAVTQERQWVKSGMWLGPVFLMVILVAELIHVVNAGGRENIAGTIIGPKSIGVSLFSVYLLGVELASMLLFIGLVGAYHIGRRLGEKKRLMEISDRELRERFEPEHQEIQE